MVAPSGFPPASFTASATGSFVFPMIRMQTQRPVTQRAARMPSDYCCFSKTPTAVLPICELGESMST